MSNNNAIRHISPAKRTIPGRSSELAVIIPAAGIGRRMKDKNPKALSMIHGTSLIERQINAVWTQFPKSEIFVVVGYQADKIRDSLHDYPIRFIHNPIYESTNVAFSIGLALQASTSRDALIVYGDLYFNKEAISHISDGNSKILVDTARNFSQEEVGFVTDEHNRVTNFSYGLSRKWAQIAYLTDWELDLFKSICYNVDAGRWFGYEALNETIEKGGRLETQEVSSSYVIDIDTQQDLQKANQSFIIPKGTA
jgi:choline kinase